MRSKLRRKRSFLYAIVLLCAVVLGMLWVTSDTASAGTQESVRHKYFTSIEIKEGTSLWEIAQEYQTEEYDSTEDYIREVKKINHMKSDVICAFHITLQKINKRVQFLQCFFAMIQ